MLGDGQGVCGKYQSGTETYTERREQVENQRCSEKCLQEESNRMNRLQSHFHCWPQIPEWGKEKRSLSHKGGMR